MHGYLQEFQNLSLRYSKWAIPSPFEWMSHYLKKNLPQNGIEMAYGKTLEFYAVIIKSTETSLRHSFSAFSI